MWKPGQHDVAVALWMSLKLLTTTEAEAFSGGHRHARHKATLQAARAVGNLCVASQDGWAVAAAPSHAFSAGSLNLCGGITLCKIDEAGGRAGTVLLGGSLARTQPRARCGLGPWRVGWMSPRDFESIMSRTLLFASWFWFGGPLHLLP